MAKKSVCIVAANTYLPIIASHTCMFQFRRVLSASSFLFSFFFGSFVRFLKPSKWLNWRQASVRICCPKKSHIFNTNTHAWFSDSITLHWSFCGVHDFWWHCMAKHIHTQQNQPKRNLIQSNGVVLFVGEFTEKLFIYLITQTPFDIGFTVRLFFSALLICIFWTYFFSLLWYFVISFIKIFWRIILIQLPSFNIVAWHSLTPRTKNQKHSFRTPKFY